VATTLERLQHIAMATSSGHLSTVAKKLCFYGRKKSAHALTLALIVHSKHCLRSGRTSLILAILKSKITATIINIAGVEERSNILHRFSKLLAYSEFEGILLKRE
jgi:hypothetical protein